MLTTFQHLRGFTLSASDGELGKVSEFYFDDQHWFLRYLVVETGSWLLGRRVLIAPSALGEVDAQRKSLAVNLTQEQVREAPPSDSDRPVSRQHEEDLHRHYGWSTDWMGPGGSGLMMPWPLEIPVTAGVESLPATEADNSGNPYLRSSAAVGGYRLHPQDGEFAGEIADFVLDDEGWRIRYLVVDARKWLSGNNVVISPECVERISYEFEEVFVNLPSSMIKTAPEFDPEAPIGRPFEERMQAHYGFTAYWAAVHSEAL